MKALRDPEKKEVEHLNQAWSLAGKRILEIGCGSGQIAWQYAQFAGAWVGIDPSHSELLLAASAAPLVDHEISLVEAIGEALPLPACTFDAVLFASSL